ncbi:hypothetical protein N9917_01265 [Deltaproteobacteria bacterium]|nr:hypothetical protein [Deltaproteobacteria bacterium]
MTNKNYWSTLLALRVFWDKAQEHADDPLKRLDWAVDPHHDDSLGHSQSEVDDIYAEVIAKIPAGATKVLDLGCGEGGFYRALQVAKPGLAYKGIDLVPENIEEAQTAKGIITMAGVQSGDTVTLGAVVLTASGSQTASGLDFDESIIQATGTVTCAGVQAGDEVKVGRGGVVLTASGSQTASGLDFDETAGTDILVADSLVAAVNDAGNGLNDIVTADNAGGTTAVVTFTAVPLGTGGNESGLHTSAPVRLAWGQIEGGVGSNVDTASSLVAAINDSGNGLNGTVVASNDNGTSAVVTVRAAALGTGGNATTLASSQGTRLAVSGATLADGVDAGVFETGNMLEFLAEATVDWDFIVCIGSALTYTDNSAAKLLFDLINAKALRGFIILADPRQAEAQFLTDNMVPALAESVNVAESYYEGARAFLDDALLKNLVPFYIHRDSTPATAPALPAGFCDIATGQYNRALGRAVGKREAAQGREIPADFKGITSTGGRVTGRTTTTLDTDWVRKVRVRQPR